MGVELAGDQAVVVHRERDQLQSRGARRLPQAARAGILDPDVGMPVLGQRPRQLGHGGSGAGEDGHGPGRSRRPSPPVEVVGQDGAQPRFPPVLGVAKLVERRGLRRRPDRLDPLGLWEGAEVGSALGEVVADGTVRSHRPRDGAVVRLRRPADPRRRPGPAREVAFGDELAVRPGHRPARDVEVGRERAAGRKRPAERQPSSPDRRPDRRRQPHVQGPRPGRREVKERFPGQIGLRLRHAIGS
jgi:hypothetical protein